MLDVTERFFVLFNPHKICFRGWLFFNKIGKNEMNNKNKFLFFNKKKLKEIKIQNERFQKQEMCLFAELLSLLKKN